MKPLRLERLGKFSEVMGTVGGSTEDGRCMEGPLWVRQYMGLPTKPAESLTSFQGTHNGHIEDLLKQRHRYQRQQDASYVASPLHFLISKHICITTKEIEKNNVIRAALSILYFLK